MGLFRTELINRRGPWKNFTDVESATAEWIDWYNHRRLHGALGHVSPAECETACHHQHTRARQSRRLVSRLNQLGYQVTLQTVEAA
ncbi:transposase [Streptomyces sp. GC420]|nr:transposase [Streptomyces sp. GC420]